MPTNQDLTAAEVRLLTVADGRELRLREALAPVRGDYDVILIDCPPSLNMLTLNALVAADSVLIPMQCEYYALEGLSALVAHDRAGPRGGESRAARSKASCAPCTTRGTTSPPRCRRSCSALRRQGVPHRDPAQRAAGRGAVVRQPGLLHDKESRGALAYLALAGEMLRREDEAQTHHQRRRGARPRRRHVTWRMSSHREADAGTWTGGLLGQAPGAASAGHGRPARRAGDRRAGRDAAATRARRRTNWRACRSICCSAASTSRASTCGPKRWRSSRIRSAPRA